MPKIRIKIAAWPLWQYPMFKYQIIAFNEANSMAVVHIERQRRTRFMGGITIYIQISIER